MRRSEHTFPLPPCHPRVNLWPSGTLRPRTALEEARMGDHMRGDMAPSHRLACSMGLVLVLLVGLVPAAQARLRAEASYRAVSLDRGKVGRFVWVAGASRGRGPEGLRAPCLKVATRDLGTASSPPSPFEGFTSSCGAVDGAAAVAVTEGEGAEVVTIFVIGLSARARSLSVSLGSAGDRTLKAHYLTPRQRQLSGLHGFRFAAFAVEGSACIERLISYDSNSKPIYSSSRRSCG